MVIITLIRFTLLSLILGVSSASAQKAIIHCGTLIDGVSNKTSREMSIVIEKDRIISIQSGYVEPDSSFDAVYDLKNNTVMPGLMDMHVHLMFEFSKRTYTEKTQLDPVDYAYKSVRFAERTLMAGFTTVRDVGGNTSIALRNAVNKGWVIGPRILAAGISLATTGGHADPTNGLREDLEGDPGPLEGVINSPKEARKAVRKHYKDGADLIKITATGGVLSQAKSGRNAQFTLEELRAVVETAKDYGFTVAAHAHGVEGMKRAVLAGVTSIEHGTFMDDEVMQLMKKRGTYYVPTLSPAEWATEKTKEEGFFPEVVRKKAMSIGPIAKDTFTRAYKAGVKIAFGTDTGVTPHGQNWKEFVYMVDADMPAMKAIQSATIEAAKLIRMDDDLGSIEKGKIADIVAVPGNPLKDIEVMGKVDFVMKAGVVYKK